MPLIIVARPLPRRVLVVLAVVASLLMTLAPDAPAASAKTLKAQLTEAVRRQQAAQARDAEVAEDIVKLQRKLVSDEKALKLVRVRLSQRARLVYTSGIGGAGLEVMVTSDDPDAALERISLLDASTRSDRTALQRAASVRRRVEATRRRLVLARRDSAKALASMRAEGALIARLLQSAESAEAMDALNARKEASALRRSRRATRSGGSLRLVGNYACMVGSNHAFTDTWGAARSGGRRHKGVDVFAPWGSPAYAVTDGRISNIHQGGNGGKMVYLRGNDGNEYFYSHMSSYASSVGDRVKAGEIIAYVGDTGNARGGSPHIHFEVHPGGGAPINPTPFAHRVCG